MAAARRGSGDVRLHRQYRRLRRRLRGPRRVTSAVLVPRARSPSASSPRPRSTAPDAAVDGNFDDCLELARKPAADYPVTALVNSVNPVRLQGQKSAAFEVCDVLDGPRTCTACRSATPGTSPPTGWVTRSTQADALVVGRPRMFGFQAAGAAPLVHGAPVLNPETVATAIRVGNPASWDGRAGPGRVRWAVRGGHRRADPHRLPAAGRAGGGVRRTVLGHLGGGIVASRRGRSAATRFAGGLHGHRARAQRPGLGGVRRAPAAGDDPGGRRRRPRRPN